MMNQSKLKTLLGNALVSQSVALGEVTCEVTATEIKNVCTKLRDELGFEMLVDLCGMDYSTWGKGDEMDDGDGGSDSDDTQRFAVVYHLLSVQHNSRLRLRAHLPGDAPAIDSVTEIYPAADWYEREAFDLFGILFNGHPDLRRLLTDYGFIGHPMRKDFPLSGQVEMRYDEEQGRVIYQPVTIPPRILVPRTIGDAPHADEKVNRQAD